MNHPTPSPSDAHLPHQSAIEQAEAQKLATDAQRFYPTREDVQPGGHVQSFTILHKSAIRRHGATTDAQELTLQPQDGLPANLKPGMQIGLFVRNPEPMVQHVLTQLADIPDTLIPHRSESSAASHKADILLTPTELLERFIDISRPSLPLLLWLAEQPLPADHPAIPQQQALRQHVLNNTLEQVQAHYTVPMLAECFPGVLTLQALQTMQPPLANRKYTLSDINHAEGTFRIMVGGIDHKLEDARLLGEASPHTASSWRGASSARLLDAAIGATITGFMDIARQKIPYPSATDETPVLLVSTGVGLAPHMSYLRDIARHPSPAAATRILIAGGRTQQDELIADELHTLQQRGILSHYTHATSREGERHYVQDAMRQQAADIFAMLEQGGMVCVCGLKPMYQAVKTALIDIARSQQHPQPEAWLETLEQQGRLRASVSVPTRFHDAFAHKQQQEIQATTTRLQQQFTASATLCLTQDCQQETTRPAQNPSLAA